MAASKSFELQDRPDIISADERLSALDTWIRSLPGLAEARLAPASGDASFRRYFRVETGDGSWIAMDAPPGREDVRPFVEIAGYLRSMSLNAPEIIADNAEQGFLLMSDLGRITYLQRLTDDGAAQALYGDALAALLRMQTRGSAFQSRLPPYDEALLRDELGLFHDWLCERHLGMRWSPDEEAAWQAVCDLLVDNALEQPVVFVHRDYHSRNLMVTERRNPGILDFQDAVAGPLTYDLVSLLKDCYYRLDEDLVETGLTTFIEAHRQPPDAVDAATVRRWFELMGVQRHLKAAGIFARLYHRDGKANYLGDVPLTLGYILEVAPRYPLLGPLKELIESRCLPELEAGA